jgi:type IV pilus assembly protein PilQ
MPNAIRILILGACAALGLGVAIALAMSHPEPQPVPDISPTPVSLSAGAALAVAQPAANQEPIAPAVHAPVTAPVTASVTAPVTAPVTEIAVAPELVEYRKAVSGQIDDLQESIELLDRNSQRQEEFMNSVFSRLQEQNRAPPPETPLPQPPAVPQPPAAPPTLPRVPVEPPPAAQPEALPPARAPRIERNAGSGNISLNFHDEDIRNVLEIISDQGGLNILASKSVTGTVTATLTNVTLETALAAILKSTGYVARREGEIIYIGTPADFGAMDQTEDRLVTRVYRPNYVKAADLQGLFTSLLTPEVGKVTVSSPAEVDIPADMTKTGGNNLAATDVVIVRDYEAVIKQLDQIFIDVDCRPQQVSIEAMILSVKLSDQLKLGVDFEALRANNNVRLISGSPLANLGAIDPTQGGLKFGYLDANLALFINALETVGDTNVIASPRLMCLNKQRAEIQIGEQLGYVSTTVTENSATQTVNFLDVGTLLRLRPYISNDGLIRLEIHPELSTGSVAIEQGLTLPKKAVTQVTTNVMCSDGCTIVIGGLIREDQQTTTNQIPLLGSLPWLGPAFRQKTEKLDRNEIIVLITPRIVSEPMMCKEGAKLGNEFAQRQDVYFDKMSPIGRRNYGNHWLRKARAAYNAQDYDLALREVNLAIHFDPLNRNAITLRNDIVAAGGFEDESIHDYLKVGLYPWQRRFGDYSKQGVPWQKPEGFSDETNWRAMPDPGQPGPLKTIDRPRPDVIIPEPLEQATTPP